MHWITRGGSNKTCQRLKIQTEEEEKLKKKKSKQKKKRSTQQQQQQQKKKKKKICCKVLFVFIWRTENEKMNGQFFQQESLIKSCFYRP